MNKKQMRSMLKDLTEQKAPAAEIDLWPVIQSRLDPERLQTSNPTQLRGIPMNTRQPSIHRLRLAALFFLAVILTGILFFTTPQGQALAQEVQHFFTHSESNRMPGPTQPAMKWVEQTPGVPAATMTPWPTPPGPAFAETCGNFNNPTCTIEEIRAKVTFPVFQLTHLPDGLALIGATGGPDGILITYATQDRSGVLMINEGPWSGSQDLIAWEVGASAEIRSVKVGEVTAEYVKGSYDGNRNPPEWNADLALQALRWVDQGVLFTVYMNGTQPKLEMSSLAALMGSLTDGPVAVKITPVAGTATPTPEPFNFHPLYPLTLAEAEEKAGFAVQLPERLPEILSFSGASYDPDAKIVVLLYHYNDPNMPENTNGLGIREALAAQTGDCPLCGIQVGVGADVGKDPDALMVGAEATVETVQIGSVKGEYVEGVWNGTDKGWVWVSDPYVKHLRWRMNGMAFELSYFGMEITQEDLIAIAQSMK